MKKFAKLSVIAVIVMMFSLCLTSCGEPPLKGDAAVGTWTMSGAEYAGMTLSADDLKTVLNDMPVFVINEDGSATFTFQGTGGDGTVTKNENGTYTLSDDSEETVNFEIADDGSLRLDYKAMNMIMIFKK